MKLGEIDEHKKFESLWQMRLNPTNPFSYSTVMTHQLHDTRTHWWRGTSLSLIPNIADTESSDMINPSNTVEDKAVECVGEGSKYKS